MAKPATPSFHSLPKKMFLKMCGAIHIQDRLEDINA
jgi:hypothetical protein